MRHAIATGEFELNYQPQIDVRSGAVHGVEALLRWRRGDRLLTPAEFLPAIEQSRAIAPLTEHVIALALAQAGAWRRGGRELRVSVNTSVANLRDESLPQTIAAQLDANDVPPGSLGIEVTETAVLHEPERARAVLEAIAALGVVVSVDDFGTGYSSLQWLRLFPVAEVKIDRSFVAELHDGGEAYVSGVIRLAHDLGLPVVAEGVETRETLDVLGQLDCDQVQGYLFSPPLPAATLEAWVDDHVPTSWTSARRELELPAELEQLDVVRAFVERTASELGFSATDVWDLKLATTEAVVNAIEHGSGGPEATVHIRVAHRSDALLVDVWDTATGESVPAGAQAHRGRGIRLMTSVVDEVDLSHKPRETRVRLTKRRSA